MQKTAYEMRISDWSSDVCSSDLSRQDESIFRQGADPVALCRRLAISRSSYGADRKSVVAGKSVSVRVGLGGRRIIQKNVEISSNKLPGHSTHSHIVTVIELKLTHTCMSYMSQYYYITHII